MLHEPCPRRPQRRGRHPRNPQPLLHPLLSVTTDTLPPTVAYVIRRVRRRAHPAHWLIVTREGIDYDELAQAYARDPDLGWARVRLFGAVGVVDPAEDMTRYHATRWWETGWQLSTTTVELMEDAAGPDLVTPWPHQWLLDPPV